MGFSGHVHSLPQSQICTSWDVAVSRSYFTLLKYAVIKNACCTSIPFTLGCLHKCVANHSTVTLNLLICLVPQCWPRVKSYPVPCKIIARRKKSMVGKKEGTGAGRILLWSSLFLMLWSSPIKKNMGSLWAWAICQLAAPNWHYSGHDYECQRLLLWAGDLSWVYAASRPKASGIGSNQGCPIILAYLSLVFPLDHSIIPWFSSSFLNWCSHGSCTEWSLQWQERSLICSLAPVLYVPKLPVQHFCWMNLYDWLLQVGHCETDTITSMWVRVSPLTYRTCVE